MVEDNVKSEYQEFNDIFRNRLIELVKDRLTKREIEKFGEFTISGIGIGSKHNDFFANKGARDFKRKMFGICGKNREMLRDDLVALLREFGFRYAEIDRSLELIGKHSQNATPMGVYVGKGTINRFYKRKILTMEEMVGRDYGGGGGHGVRSVPVKRYIIFRANKTSDGQDSYRMSLVVEDLVEEE